MLEAHAPFELVKIGLVDPDFTLRSGHMRGDDQTHTGSATGTLVCFNCHSSEFERFSLCLSSVLVQAQQL